MNYVDNLPITATAVEQTIRRVRNGYVLSITPEQWQILRHVAEAKQIAQTEDCLQLLENFAVLQYCDDEGPWYDVNPVIREAREFKT